jgi:hypothetical protein
MAIYEVSIRKTRADNDLFAWSNVYHVDATDLGAAATLANTLSDLEVSIHNNFARIHSAHIVQVGTPADAVTIPIDLVGSHSEVGQPLPYFVAVRVDFIPQAGRAGRKFYHLPLTEGDQNNGQLEGAMGAFLQGAFDSIAADFSGWLTNPTGSRLYTQAVVQGLLTQHQFKRKWARRGVPA